MNRRIAAAAVALVVILGLAIVLITTLRGNGDRTICAERERATERIDDIEGAGYREGLESLEAIGEAADRARPPDTELRALTDQLAPLLEEVADAYDEGGFDGVDRLPADTLREFERLTVRLDQELAVRCDNRGRSPTTSNVPPQVSVPPPTMKESTTPTTS